MTKQASSLLLILISAFLVGCTIMSLEMLASRYLNPYFGSTIFTWASLISVVLLAMMSGYFLGGFSADKLKIAWTLEAMICLAAIYLIALPYFVDQTLDYIITATENVQTGSLLGAVVITLIPVTLLSTFTPIAIRRSLQSVEYAGRIAGTVFAISTAGNILGTLLTSFYLIPNYGTRELTGWLAIVLGVAAVIVFMARRTSIAKSAALTILVCVFFIHPLSDGQAKAKIKYIDKAAGYPEGAVFIKGDLYYTEMTRNRVMKVEKANGNDQNPALFFYQKGCGPTSLAPYKEDEIVILCHISNKLVIISITGEILKSIKTDLKGQKIYRPNDCINDKKGGVFFSAPGDFDKTAQPMGRLYHLSKKGTVNEIAEKLNYPNGVTIFNGHLYVSEHLANRILKYQIIDDDTLREKTIFTDLPNKKNDKEDKFNLSGPDGIEANSDGTIYVANYGKGRILVFKPTGELKETIPTIPKYVTNLALDKSENNLVITGAKELTSFLQKGVVYQRKRK